MCRRFFAFAAMLLMLIFSVTALAAIPGINNSRYIKMYVLSSGNDTPVFTDARLNQRGTSNPYRSYNATIYANDEIWVFAMNDSFALISYPTSSGRREGYVRTSDLTSNNFSKNAQKARGQLTNIYARPGVRYSGSSISNGDDVWTVSRQGNYTQVVYPTGSTYKMAWITNSDYDNYIASQSSGGVITVGPTNPMAQTQIGGRYRTINDGWYRIQPMHELGHSADALGVQFKDGNNIHLWENIDCDQQKFYLQNRGNGYFSLQSGYGSKLFVTADGSGNGANLYTSPWRGSDSQLFRLADAGNNSYHVFGKVGNELNFDSAGAGRGNGTNVQLWTSENNDWHKWRFTSVTAPSVNHNPQGSITSADSPAHYTLHVKGTAFDEDNPNASIRVHVYVGGTPGSSVPQYEIRTNGSNRVFEDTRTIDRNYAGRQLVHIYALNDHGSGNNVEIWQGYVDIQGQSAPSGNLPNGLLYPMKGSISVSSTRTLDNGVNCDYTAFQGEKTEIRAPYDGYVEFRQVYSTKYNALISYANHIVFTTTIGNDSYEIKLCHLSKFVGAPDDSRAISRTLTRPPGCGENDKDPDGELYKQHKNTITFGNRKVPVSKNQLIGYAGQTGNAKGVHVHMEVRKNGGKPLDPKSVFTTW